MIYIISYYLLINLINYFLMGADKNKAKRGEWRIKESTLWWIALVGGALGGLIGMNRFRHKTKHTSFVIGFPLITILHVFLFIYLIIKLA
ncbi:DUF1294 domain-containing protein [uncultured Metabacillus sp.]|uniref:DUF1294 domain-containing protein n=1 Tax=Metabacillus sp. Hm71 TaxID=3450743 RepID=UPI0026193AA4|nr:DUF1294 domain-containing protein [uncultured Metabacillus sp.]